MHLTYINWRETRLGGYRGKEYSGKRNIMTKATAEKESVG